MSNTENATEDAQANASADESADAGVKRGGKLIGLLIAVTLVGYLIADRYTPYTDQARIEGYVIGVAPQVAGIVDEVLVTNNAQVKAGDVMFRIDPAQYEIALQKARSDYDNAVHQVDAGDAAVAAARANLASARANLLKAQQDTSRLERLRREDPGTISTRRLEISRATLKQSEAAVVGAEASVQQAIESKGGAASNEDNTFIRTARSAVEKAELDLARTVVRAKTDGVVTDLRTEVGQYAGTGGPVMTLVATQDLWVNAEFTENNLGRMQVGTPVELLFDIFPGEVFEGSVTSIGLGVSASNQPPAGTLPTIDNDRDWLRQSQRFPVVVSFKNDIAPEQLNQLRIGGQSSVIAYNEGSGAVAWLGWIWMRLMSILSYAY
ncbi:MAG: HlyD family secretion protein [Halioglobus sp.]